MLEIREATTDEDLGHMVAIIGRVSPDNPMSVEEARWQDAQYPGGKRYVAWLDGVPVGCGGAGRVYMYAEDFPALWGNISVLPEFRGRGYAAVLLRLALGIARDTLGLDRVLVTCDDDNVGSIRTIKRNGGTLENVVAGRDSGPPTRRYWIDTRGRGTRPFP